MFLSITWGFWEAHGFATEDTPRPASLRMDSVCYVTEQVHRCCFSFVSVSHISSSLEIISMP